MDELEDLGDRNVDETIERNSAVIFMRNSGYYDGVSSNETIPSNDAKYWEGYSVAYQSISESGIIDGKLQFIKDILSLNEHLFVKYGEKCNNLINELCNIQTDLSELALTYNNSEESINNIKQSNYAFRISLIKDQTDQLCANIQNET